MNPSSIGGIEADRRRGVHRDVDAGRDLGLAAAEVAVDHLDALVQHRHHARLAHPLTQRVERGLAEEVLDALAARGPGLAAHQQDHAGLGEVGQEAFEDDLREEAGHPGEQHRLAGEGLDDRGRRGRAGLALYHAADYAVSTGR